MFLPTGLTFQMELRRLISINIIFRLVIRNTNYCMFFIVVFHFWFLGHFGGSSVATMRTPNSISNGLGPPKPTKMLVYWVDILG